MLRRKIKQISGTGRSSLQFKMGYQAPLRKMTRRKDPQEVRNQLCDYGGRVFPQVAGTQSSGAGVPGMVKTLGRQGRQPRMRERGRDQQRTSALKRLWLLL